MDNQGKIKAGRPQKPNDMEYYDNLPPAYRKLEQEFPLKLNSDVIGKYSKTMSADEMRQALIDNSMRRETLFAYGPDHPQAAKHDNAH